MSIAYYSTNKKPGMTEYGKLTSVIVCPPSFMKISEVINETQKHFLEDNINKKRAIEQHKQFVQTLLKHKVNVHSLPEEQTFPEQVFTRDIGFTIGGTVFVSNMGCGIRQGEEKVLSRYLRNRGISHYELQTEKIEGGDVLVDGNKVFVGVSKRTASRSIAFLQSLLPDFEVTALPFESKYLHLDCVFNIVSPTEALIFSPAFSDEQRKLLAQQYNLIEVNEAEQFSLGTNILSIGNKKIISQPINKKVNADLRTRGYEVIEVDFSEIIKSGGSFRCCSMPLERR